jgi:alginate O-acetyltransferase complex protein AlgJ
MPLREQAVHANSWISLHVFDTNPGAGSGHGGVAGAPATPAATATPEGTATPAPADQVLVGKDGWLYLAGELKRPCEHFIDFSVAMQRWKRLVSIIRASGRPSVLAIAPDKASVQPEHLPDEYADKACQGAPRRAQWHVLGRPDPRIAWLRPALLERMAATGRDMYVITDSHWNTAGSAELVRGALAGLGTDVRLLDQELQWRRSKPQPTDLANLLGQPRSVAAPRLAVVRAAGAPTLPGQTLLIEDSYGQVAEDQFRPYAEHLRIETWPETPPEELIAAMREADTVILESVERELDYRASDAGIVTPAFLDAVARALPPRAARSARTP